MLIEFDPTKDAANVLKHGMSLADAKGFEWGSAVTWMDLRQDYGEDRVIALGYIGPRLCCMVFVEREGTEEGETQDICRVISLRPATLREIQRYAET